ncbi:MAG: VIT domain-containing protein [Betaproteobacteria bacterium]
MLDPLAVFLGNAIAERGLVPIPLISTDHEVALVAGLAVVTTHRLFRNSESVNIEAVLTFPVPVHATLFDLTAEIEGRELHARAQARSQAREVYEEAVTQGKSAVLHEELLKGIHMISVANIQPGGEVKVTTKWAMPLSVVTGRATLRIPQTLGDVYGRSGLSDADDLLTGGPSQPVMVSIKSEGEVEVVGAQLIEGRVAVSSADPIDVVGSLWEPIQISGHDVDGQSVSLMLTPQSGGETALDVAVLVDHSGSMSERAGSRSSLSAHEAARNGIITLASELDAGDNVDLWEFDTQVRQLGMNKGEASDLLAARERLTNLAAQLSPPRGGTDIGGALSAVVRSSSARDILLLTDGLSHKLNIEELARCGRRISVVLIGANSLEARIGHLAALTGGDIYIATAEDLAGAMKAAIDALRRPAIALPTVADLPKELMCLRNNVEIRAHWAKTSGHIAPSEISKASRAVAASLVVNCASPEFASQYAASEGIVSHLTSLVLVDEVGAAQAELPTMRKIALPRTLNVNAMRTSAMSASSALCDLASPRAGSNVSADFDACMEYLPSSPPIRERSIRRERKASPQAVSSRLTPVQIVRLIDWGEQPELLMRGDFSCLHHVAQQFVEELAGGSQVRSLSDRYGMPPKVVAIAIVAKFASDKDRLAGRLWSSILNRLCEELADRTRLELMKPLELIFEEIDRSLRGHISELGRSVDNELGQVAIDVASKAQSRCRAITRELLAETENRLGALSRARVAEFEQEFLHASRAVKVS